MLFELTMPEGPGSEENASGDIELLSEQQPRRVLKAGKTVARSMAAELEDGARLEYARAFCGALLAEYWREIQKPWQGGWPLPRRAEGVEIKLPEEAGWLARAMGRSAAQLEAVESGYLVGTTYTALLPEETRARWGVYYTPPALAARLIEMATEAGVDWRTCRALDPACGGGAFLAPIAARMAESLAGLPAAKIVESLGQRIRGFEVDPFAAWVSQVFLEATTMGLCRAARKRLPLLAEVTDSLARAEGEAGFDLVIGNPPYGRVTLAPEVRERYKRGLYGHANLYGLFTDLAVRLAKPGGVIAYLTPTSFLAGQYFKALRDLLAREAPPAGIDFVEAREGVFEGVLQETLLAVYKRGGKQRSARVNFITALDEDRIKVQAAGKFSLPKAGGGPWLVPRTAEQEELIGALRKMPCRLADYGYEVSTGPLVWNRHKPQLAKKADKGALPLIWAESVTSDGRFVYRADKKNHQPYFCPKPGDEWLISRAPCVLVQRTTAKEQSRRVIAAELSREFLAKHRAVVVENHLNMVRPANGAAKVSARALAAFLNTEIVDRAFRCLSGSVAVSAYELEALPLPPAEKLRELDQILERNGDSEMIERFCTGLFVGEPANE